MTGAGIAIRARGARLCRDAIFSSFSGQISGRGKTEKMGENANSKNLNGNQSLTNFSIHVNKSNEQNIAPLADTFRKRNIVHLDPQMFHFLPCVQNTIGNGTKKLVIKY